MTTFATQPGKDRGGRLLLVCGILLIAFALRRGVAITFPLFLDEGLHIGYARSIAQGQFLVGLHDGKWLFPLILAAARPLGSEAVFLARVVATLSGVFSVAACVSLGRLLAGWRPGLIAGLLYAILPLPVFHEGQALVDTLMAAWLGAGLVAAIWLARRPSISTGFLCGLALALALLAKTLALPYLILPLAAALVLRRGRLHVAPALIATGVILVVGLIAGAAAPFAGVEVNERHTVTLDNTLLGMIGSGEFRSVLAQNTRDVWEAATGYLGPSTLFLIGLAVAIALHGALRCEVAFLAVPGIAFMAVPILAEQVTGAGRLPARYLLANAIPLAVMAAMALARLLDGRLPARLLGLGIGLLLLVQSTGFAAALITEPASAPLTPIDKDIQYQYSLAGDGSELAADLLAYRRLAGKPVRLLALGPGFETIMLETWLGEEADITIEGIGFAPDDVLAGWVGSGEEMLLLEGERSSDPFDTTHPMPDGLLLEPLGGYRMMQWQLRLHRVTGARGEFAQMVTDLQAPSAGQIAQEAGQIIAALPPGGRVLVFPARLAPAFPGADPLLTQRWPLDAEEIGAALMARSGAPGGRLDVILAGEQRTDPARIIQIALSEQTYHIDEAWAGPLRRIGVATGSPEPPRLPVAEAFEGGIMLTHAAIVDRQPAAGSSVRILLEWETPTRIADSFNVFVHLVDSSGALVAQHDGVPGSGLYPMPVWEPGYPVTDRVAVVLPPDAQAGALEVHVGIYNPASGLRLPVTGAAPGQPTDYVVIGQISIR